MGPVNIAVDSYGPVTDNAQSVFELAQTEKIPGIKEEIQRDFGFVPDFERGKHYLEANDSAGNTFKATAKPVLIGTAVVGATTMIFSIILLLDKVGMLKLSHHVLGQGPGQPLGPLGVVLGEEHHRRGEVAVPAVLVDGVEELVEQADVAALTLGIAGVLGM